jgi:23S rRNA (adenine2503-C2)-methyltransferase
METHNLLSGNTKPLIFDLEFTELESLIHDLGEPPYRARQIWDGLYHQFWNSVGLFSPLSLEFRNKLNSSYSFANLSPSVSLISLDKQTEKMLFILPDDQKIETVLMRYDKRHTLCISTQSGCAMGCAFCATGQMGFRRNLSPGEIVEQILYFSRILKEDNTRITNIVFMGMGEPFHNYDAVMKAIRILNHPAGLLLGERRFTISTVGIIPGIKRFTNENSQVNLAISLHAADDELRSSMLPINRRYPLAPLLEVCLEYVHKIHRRITFEWALIDGVNDSTEQANKLIRLLTPFISNGISSCHVNVIPLNPTLLYKERPTTSTQVKIFCDVLQTAGVPCTPRLRRGIDILAGCGQLASS